MNGMRALVVVVLLSACSSDVDQCPDQAHEIGPARVRDPNTLRCETPGACAAENEGVTWGLCVTSCDDLDAGACAANPECRVVEDVSCAIRGTCLTTYIGCYPVDTVPDSSINCFTADAWDCSRSNQCTAFHDASQCSDDGCARPFALCSQEGVAPGRCWEPVTCRVATPPCPENTQPGIVGGCYSGACIPLALCEPQP